MTFEDIKQEVELSLTVAKGSFFKKPEFGQRFKELLKAVASENTRIRAVKYAEEALELMLRKNHDYDEAWRSMRVSSYTDLILMKLYRTKQIEGNDGKTLISEGIDANYLDMMNYSVFGLIKLTEKQSEEK